MPFEYKKSIEAWESRLTTPIDGMGRAFFVNPNQKGRRFAIGDIHGCFQTFVNLIDRLELTRHDQVFILGDMINRGPYSILVVEYILQLLQEGYQIFPLLGNHEQLVLDSAKKGKGSLRIFTDDQSAGHLAMLDNARLKGLLKFFKKLPLYYETPFEYLVHGGFETAAKHPLKKWDAMCWIRSFQYEKKKLNGKRVIHGHVPKSIGAIRKAVDSGAKIVSLDNGCTKARVRNFGKLICMNLDSGELIAQKNIDVIPV